METDRIKPDPIPAVVVGSGNVALNVVPALEKSGAIDVLAVVSPNIDHARALAALLHSAKAYASVDELDEHLPAELYLVAVKDDAIEKVVASSKPTPGVVWLHTSGSVPAVSMSDVTEDYGVFYPLQTFSKGVEVDLSKVPVFVEGNTPKALAMAHRLGEAISPNVYEADGERRKRLHAAAVFACNFTNHLWVIADEILRRETGTDINVLRPLLEETLRKALEVRPSEAQTGPARRGDRGIIAGHAAMLTDDEARLYTILSEHILNYYNV